MSTFLLFTLYGPLAAWGNVAVGEYRPTHDHPSKSAIIGLVAAALGIPRDRDEQHARLTEDFGFAVRLDSRGVLLRDYHTVQVPPARKGLRYSSRRDELTFLHRNELKTILSHRDYRSDACYTVALWPSNDAPLIPVADIAAALEKPHFVLYLGRKSCPPALPLSPRIIEAPSLHQAFEQMPAPPFIQNETRESTTLSVYFWEETAGLQAGIPTTMIASRRDKPLSRRRWQFSQRQEHSGTLANKEESP